MHQAHAEATERWGDRAGRDLRTDLGIVDDADHWVVQRSPICAIGPLGPNEPIAGVQDWVPQTSLPVRLSVVG